MTTYSLEYTQDRNPMVNYATKNMWGNPELDSQYQIKLSRVSGNQGFINDFTYWGKRHLLPTNLSFYHVFSLAGLDIGFWNMGSRGESWYPHNQWIKASEFARNRGINIDIYAGSGSMFVRDESYIMDTFQGGTLLCIPKNINFPLPLGKNLYMHCYTVDINTRNVSDENLIKYSVGYVGSIYQKPADFDRVKLNYDTWKAYAMGQVLFWHNGKVVDIAKAVCLPGDMIEASYDPSIEIIASYEYRKMPDYYSETDKKRKVILFPGFKDKPRVYRYYDDCIYFVTNRRNGQMYYYNRNSEDAVRQLTHQDYGMAATYVDYLADRHINDDKSGTTTIDDIDITVAYHKTLWKVPVGPTSSRINDLYLLEYPEDILAALTGVNSAIPEWTANKLENSPTNLVLNRDVRYLQTKAIREGLGYNGCSVAMSNTPLYMPYDPPGTPNHKPITTTPEYSSGLGYRVPPTYVEYSTAYEYGENGLLLRLRQVINQEWYTPSPDCFYVEWALGKATQKVDYVVSQNDVKIKMGYGFRVYKAPYSQPPIIEPGDGKEIKVSVNGTDPYPPNGRELRVWELDQSSDDEPDLPDGGHLTGPWVDITGDETQYEIINGYVVFRFDTINYMGLVVSDYHHIYNSFNLSHIDNSLSFGITRSWTIGDKLLEMEPGQIDIWMNGHPLIENVDYYLDFPMVYITNKMWLVEGAQYIQYRGTGLSKNGLVDASELGIVADSVIGMNGRYNLRIDRPTRSVIGGRLWLTHTLDSGEDINHGRNVRDWNGWPYEVKHIYCANKYVDWYDTYWGYDEARELDKRISDYLTEHVKYKPKTTVATVYMEDDKYRLYSPFLSLIVNELVLGFMDAPPVSGKEIPYPAKVVDDLTREHQWLLKYDPIVNGIDLRFFTVQPYNNLSIIEVTPDQLTFIKTVNDLYLGGKVYIEGYFEVKNV